MFGTSWLSFCNPDGLQFYVHYLTSNEFATEIMSFNSTVEVKPSYYFGLILMFSKPTIVYLDLYHY